MSSSIPLQLAETIQTAHINPSPSPSHDLNPSTATSKLEPVDLEPVYTDDSKSDDIDEVDDDEEEDDDEDETEDEELYRSRVKPRPRGRGGRHQLPPMPDLRFEQSYLWSIRNADSWAKVAWITVRDQVSSCSGEGKGRKQRGTEGTREADVARDR